MLAGAYTKSLRHAYESGEETKGNEVDQRERKWSKSARCDVVCF